MSKKKAEQAEEPKVVEAEEIVEQQQDEKYTELNDRYLRLMAEYDNFKKRTLKEKADIYTNAAADVVEALLPILDTAARAAELCDPDSEDGKGVILIKKQIDDVLKSIGVQEIETKDAAFDPELHNAVMHVEDDEAGIGVVAEEFAKGYIYKEKVIRHSMVKVAN